ncbi:prostaglandin E synthase 2 [Eupeodes corollae]|uniref:prostaglandin E synthase 2 n=1 Tax=Eupeodes corollae TaxID=290404 RepID=UPI0024909E2C|nr:prostaglandin E synthase 2 [Eupeodes corollae]
MSTYRIGSVSRHLIRSTFTQSLKLQETQQIRRFAASSPKSNRWGTLKLGLIGAALGAASGTAYSLYSNWTDRSSHMEHQQIRAKVLDELPKIRITKKYVNSKDTSGLELILFQFQTCPFCCKVRAFLDYMGISYSVVEVDAVLRQDLKWSEYKKVPMVLVRRKDGKYVQLTDSSTIISILASYMINPKEQDAGELADFYPEISFFDNDGKKKSDIMNKYFLMYQEKPPKGVTSEDQEKERKWRTWADSHLVHLISPNCYRSRAEAFETFEWFSDAGEWSVHFPKWERDLMVYAGATAMWLIGGMLKKRYGLSDDVRSHIYDALNKWTDELKKKNTKFLGGNQPNLADLSVFGVLSSMEGCQAFKDCLKNTNIGEWFYGVKELVTKNRGQLIRERVEGKLPIEQRISLNA